MAGPSITPYGGDAAAHQVSQSDVAYYDLEIVDLSDDAEFTLKVPTGSVEVDIWTKVGAEPTLRWNPAGAQIPILTGGAWATGLVAVSPWTMTVATGAGVTDPVVVTINSPGPVGSLRVRFRNLAGGQVSLQALSDTRTVRIVADPTILTAVPNKTLVERTNRTMQGSIAVTVQSSALIPTELAGLPPLRGVWEKVTSDPTFTLTQASPDATFTVPGVYEDTPYTFRYRAYYDLNGNSVYDAGDEPETNQDVAVTFLAVHHRMVAVLDRSGSMSGTLPGGGESKWVASKRAAHIWLDLFAAFRAPANQHVGFITFEAGNCNYGTAATNAEVTLRNPTTAAAETNISPLGSFGALTTLDLGPPQTCTPIGDGLKRAFEILNAQPAGLTDVDAATILLLTDGYENAGVVSILPTPPAGTSSVASVLTAQLKEHLALYVLGAGQDVNEDTLNGLPALAGLDLVPDGYYRLAPQIKDLLPSFQQMLGHSIDAQDTGAVIDGGTKFATFHTNAQETRLVVVVPWDGGDDLRLSRMVGGSWVEEPIDGTTVKLLKRDTHALFIVQLKQLLGPLAPQQDWKIEWLKASVPQDLSTRGVLAMVDLHCKLDVDFDKVAYKLGETIRVTARVNAGNEVVSGAMVVAEVAGPGEGLGTFMATNGAKMGGAHTLFGLFRDRRIEHGEGSLVQLLNAASQGPDPDQPKAALFNIYLQANGLEALPTVNPVFSDGTDRLVETTPADAVLYANTFTKTDKEGTYTFRFRAEGTLPNGSTFRRVITVSKWVGVAVDPPSSPVSITAIPNPPAGMTGMLVVVMPKSKNGEFLGPFREGLVKIDASAGMFTGPVASRLDGSYERTLLHKVGEKPVITIEVDGQSFTRKGRGCRRFLVTLLEKFLGLAL